MLLVFLFASDALSHDSRPPSSPDRAAKKPSIDGASLDWPVTVKLLKQGAESKNGEDWDRACAAMSALTRFAETKSELSDEDGLTIMKALSVLTLSARSQVMVQVGVLVCEQCWLVCIQGLPFLKRRP